MTFDELEHSIGENIMIAAEVSKLLAGLNPEYIFVVHRLAKDFAAAIAWELAFKDGDMAEVVGKQGAVLQAMTVWLQRQGVNSRLLRPAAPMKTSAGR
jgi:predicted RNA-binding protein YlqC (UPF0109 family)